MSSPVSISAAFGTNTVIMCVLGISFPAHVGSSITFQPGSLDIMALSHSAVCSVAQSTNIINLGLKWMHQIGVSTSNLCTSPAQLLPQLDSLALLFLLDNGQSDSLNGASITIGIPLQSKAMHSLPLVMELS